MFIFKNKLKVKKFIDIKDPENKIFLTKINKKIYKVYLIKNAKIIQAGEQSLAVLKGNNLIEELSFQSEELIRKNIYFNKIFKKNYLTLFKKKIKGTSLSLLQDTSQKRNYFHFLFDSISKLFLIKKIKYDNILIPSLKYKFQKEIINILNLKKKIIDCEKIKILDLEKLIVIDHPYWDLNKSWNECSKNIPKWVIKFLRKKFISYASRKKFNKNIFIDRSDTKSIYGKLENNEEVKKYIIKKNFDIFKLSNFSFLDQIKIFRDAKIILSPHGAGLSNLIFCKPKTKILRFKQKQHNVYCFDNIIKYNNLIIKNLWCKTINQKLFIDLKIVKKYLNFK